MSADLRELQEAFLLAVVFGGDPEGRALPCWYGANVLDAADCKEGRIIASHFLKRRQVERSLARQLNVPEQLLWKTRRVVTATEEQMEALKVVHAAAWDPRLAVPSCQAHDDRWDGHRMPPLKIYGYQVPSDVDEAVRNYGLEHLLEARCSPFFP